MDTKISPNKNQRLTRPNLIKVTGKGNDHVPIQSNSLSQRKEIDIYSEAIKSM